MEAFFIERSFLSVAYLVPGIYPIGNFLFVNRSKGGIRSFGHLCRKIINRPCFYSVPTGNNAGIGIKVFATTGSAIQVAGSAVAEYQLFYQRILGAIVQYGDLRCVCAAFVILNGYHMVAGRHIGKIPGGLVAAVIQFIGYGVAPGLCYGYCSVI